METISSIWFFIQNQVLSMKWLNEIIGKTLQNLGISLDSILGGAIQFFIYDVIRMYLKTAKCTKI